MNGLCLSSAFQLNLPFIAPNAPFVEKALRGAGGGAILCAREEAEAMRVEFRRNESLDRPRVIVEAAEETEDVRRLMAQLQSEDAAVLNGWGEAGIERIPEAEIVRIYGESQRVYCETLAGRFLLRERLYELEARLDPRLFVRISNSEIVNSRQILRLDASLTGTLCLHMRGGARAYASRRYVPGLKKHFGL